MSTNKYPQHQQQQYQLQQQGAPSRLQDLSSQGGHITNTSNFPDTQAHERSGSSPLLHTRFRSPTDSVSVDPHLPDNSSRTYAASPENFIDLRESGAYEAIEDPKAPHQNNSYGYAHGVPARSGHGVTPILQFRNGSLLPVNGQQQLPSRFSPMTPDTEPEVDFPNPNRTGPSPYGQNPNGLAVTRDDYDRNSWGTQFSEQNGARQTWMTTTSGVTAADPFSFRHFESPQTSAVPQDLNAPTLVVHSPPNHDQLPYTIGQAEESVAGVAYVPPSPTEAVPQGRMPSKVPVANRYNFSRPMRSELRVSNASSATNAIRGSEYSSMSTSTDIHRAVSHFPDPPIPETSAPSSYAHQQELDQPDQLTRRAMKRMSVPKTMPNLAYTDDQLSPSPTMKDLGATASPRSNPMHLSSSPGASYSNLAPRSLSPIRDRSPSPSGGTSESTRYQSQSPVPPPPRSYEVPYTYHVTITDHQYQDPYAGTRSENSHSSSGHMTRYSQGGTALPPAPREVVALPSSPPPVGPRPGSNLSLYSRYSFYSANDLPESGAPTPKGWEKNGSAERLRAGGVSPSRSDQTPTPTGMKSKGKGKEDEQSGLPYLNSAPYGSTESGPPTGTTTAISPQECLLLGISHHEADRLEESAYWFEKTANENGGCGVGMFMWGLSLRHAWGVERDERAAFWWLRRAAECAVADMERTKEAHPEGGEGSVEVERDRKAVQNELVLAVYEVGQCFFHGWGVETDKKMAVSYFQVAARLGDMDAQLELGFCYAKGKGCKKDLKESARWYRAAAAQGASTIGLAWIYKPKYGGGGGDEQYADTPTQTLLPSSKASSTVPSSARSTNGKPEPRRLKKPPPRSRTPIASTKSPVPTNASLIGSSY